MRKSAPIAVLLVALGCGAGAATALGPELEIPASAGEHCVEPTPVIRREHMRFLLHQRERTVHEGIRGARHSLVGCVSCHVNRDASGTAIPIDARGQFCEACHTFVGVRMDCFGCHATTPD